MPKFSLDELKEAFEAYLRQYPNGAFASLARLKIKELGQPKTEVAAGCFEAGTGSVCGACSHVAAQTELAE